LPAVTDFDVRIYPNPARSVINIEWTEFHPGKMEAELFDVVGKRMVCSTWQAQRINELRLPQLPEGVYLLKISAGNSSQLKKIMIVR
jgi:hypothetical protein